MFKVTVLLLAVLFSRTLLAAPVWQVTQGDNTFYVGGTIHVLSEQDYPLPESFEVAYNASKVLFFETDMHALNDVAVQQNLLQRVSLPAGETLQNYLDPVQYQALENWLREAQLPSRAFDRYKTGFVTIQMLMIELQRAGISAPGVDQYYFNRAAVDDKSVGELESIDDHLAFFETYGEGVESELMEMALDELKSIEYEMDSMRAAWRQGEISYLEALYVTTMKDEFPELYQTLLVDRNRAWMPALIEMGKTPETELVLVGVAHLLGPDGVLIGLEQAGFEVTRVQN
ncbi:TraB/GumN family protein [uncultured Umboniibacter sp.]|uniref:TraB/GumN family protein n=1 Tax=uncultured Umboniibacter sp. TaxID=1798917 RepID=UPI00261518E0|nr:TraB/GumN family protein [uncultured Umboniibacter sp.]